jgi:small GTP-binding protein
MHDELRSASVLERLFGRRHEAGASIEQVLADACSGIGGLLHGVAQRCAEWTEPAVDAAGAEVLADLLHTAQGLGELERSLPGPADPMRVVLLGRTQAGKSTLFSFLTASDASPAGNGAQRFTRSVVEMPMSGRADILIIDTPGVGALDGDDDRELALDAARRADLVVWVATSNSQPSETAEALARVAQWGVPMLLVINCREVLDGEDAVEQFLTYPESAFAALDGHLARLRRFLDPHGQRPMQVLPLHAAAALVAVASDQPHTELLQASRVDTLGSALVAEAGRRHVLRAVAICDSARRTLCDAANRLSADGNRLAIVADTRRDASADFDRRTERLLAGTDLQVQVDVGALFRRLDDWADRHYQCTDAELQSRWDADEERLRADAGELLQRSHSRMCRRLRRLDEDVATAWSKRLEINMTSLNEISVTGLVPRWVEAAGRTALGVAGAAVGFAIGTLLGNAPGGIIGTSIGGAVGERLGALIRVRRGQLVRRRNALQAAVRDALGSVKNEVDESWIRCMESVRQDLDDRARERAQAVQRTADLAEHTTMVADAARIAAASGDALLSRTLLGLEGRHHLASRIAAVHRHPGFATIVSVEDADAFRELVLCPPVHALEQVRTVPAGDQPTGLRQVAYAVDAGRRHAVLVPDGALTRIHIPEDLSTELLRVEADLIGRVVNVPIVLHSRTARLSEATA